MAIGFGCLLLFVAAVSQVFLSRSRESADLFGFVPPPLIAVYLLWFLLNLSIAAFGVVLIGAKEFGGWS